MIFHNYFVFELRISKLMILQEWRMVDFIKVFLFIDFATKALRHEVFLTAKGAIPIAIGISKVRRRCLLAKTRSRKVFCCKVHKV